MRNRLLEPTASVMGLYSYVDHNIQESLGIEHLASYLESLGYNCQCEVVQQRCEQRDEILNEIVEWTLDILGINTQVYNIDDALWFVREAKKINSALVIVLGGNHASVVPKLVEKSEYDYVIIGQCEFPFSELIEVLKGQKDMSVVLGIAYYNNGKIHLNPWAPRIDRLDMLPFPKQKKSILSQWLMHALMYAAPSKQTYIGMITATQGCPYSCNFCCSQLIWNPKIKNTSSQNVADELEIMHSEFDINWVFFCNLTFNASKKYTIALCEEISRRNVPIHFYAISHLKGMD